MKFLLHYLPVWALLCMNLNGYAQPKKLADFQLSNLDSITAINSHLLPESSGTKDLGKASLLWNNLYLKKLHYLNGTQGAGKVMASNSGGEASWYSFITGSTGSDFSIQFTGNDFVFNLPDASSASRGLLTAADWIAFNSKQGALNGTGLVRVNGTSITYDNTAYVPANRTLTINGTPYDLSEDRVINIGGLSLAGIGNSPNANGATLNGTVLNLEPANENFGGVITTGAQTFSGLKTFSNDITVNTMTIGKGNGQINSNSAIGFETLGANTTGQNNTALGFRSLKTNTTGSNNIAIGTASLFNNLNGSVNTAIGQSTLQNNTSGFINTAVGANALQNNINGWGNAALGHQALQSNSSGEYNTASGFNALKSNTDGDENTALGSNADVAGGSLTNSTAIGARAYVAASNSMVLGSINGVNGATSNTNVGIGTTSPTNRLHVAGTVRIEDGSQGAGKVLTSDINGVASWQNAPGGSITLTAIGSAPNSNGASVTGTSLNLQPANENFGGVVSTGSQIFAGSKTFLSDLKVNTLTIGLGSGQIYTNTVFGYESLGNNTTGTNNSAFGFRALKYNTTGNNNIALGSGALFNNLNGSVNTAIGQSALLSNTSGLVNTAVGATALLNNLTGSGNSAFGYQSLQFNNTGEYNTASGLNALYANVDGDENTAIGYNANVATGNLNNATAIGARALVASSHSIVLGSINGVNGATNSTNVGIGTTSPTSRLHVAGTVRIEDGSQGAGKVLTSDANGVASWQAATGGSLSLAAVGSSPNNNGATLSGNTLNLEPASATYGGVVTTTNQTFGGTKTFNNDVFIKWIRAGAGSGTGMSNTIFGENSLQSNTTGSGNTGMGWNSLSQNTTGEYNTANGYGALRDNSSGKLNTASGLQALLKNISGDDNTASGHNALFNNTSGGYNAAVGAGALYTNSTGSLNTAIGVAADVSLGNLSNATAIGSGSVVSSSNTVRIGNASVTSIGGEVGWSTLSDGRYKTNLKNNVPGLEFINQLKPVTYNLDVQKIQRKLTGTKQARTNGVGFTDPMENAIMKKAMDEKSKVVYTGFVAQEVAQIADKMGYDFSGVDKPQNENESFYAIRYAEFVVPLVKAVQELSAENEALKNRLEKIESLLAKGASNESDKSLASTVFLSSARLDQNIPNPAGNQTLIKYYIPQNTQQAEIRITGIRGELIKSIRLNSKGEGQVNLSMEYLVNGNYIYSLFVDGQIIDSRKMVITR